MLNLEQYPHISRFDDIPIAYASALTEKQFSEAKASLDNLKNLLPDWQINLDKNIDLLGIAFNAAVVNSANKNGDVMDTKTAIRMFSSFQNKLLNREHKRDKIIGHIVNARFSSYGESNLLYPMDVEETQDPFNISLGAVVYKIVDTDYAKQIEESANEDSPKYNSLSASWEVGMTNYKIAMGSPNLKECQIIDNPKHVAELKQYLRAYGGDGTYNNAPIFRLIGEDCLALGCAITSRPAANVKGLLTKKKNEENPNEPSSQTSRASFFNNFFDKNQKPSVTPNKTPQNMEKLEQILEEIKAHMIKDNTTKGFEAAIADKIREASESYTAKVNEAKASQEKAEKEAAEFKAAQEALATQLAETKDKLAKIEAAASAKEAADLFSTRMAEFDAEFDLEDDDRQILATDLKALDSSEAAFTSYKDKMAKLMKDKNKKGKEAKEKEAKASIDKLVAEKLAEISKASSKKLSDKELAEKALEEAKASETKLPNNNGNQNTDDLKEAWAKAFSADNIKISFN